MPMAHVLSLQKLYKSEENLKFLGCLEIFKIQQVCLAGTRHDTDSSNCTTVKQRCGRTVAGRGQSSLWQVARTSIRRLATFG